MARRKTVRTAIPKRVRMEVFKRDGFTCQYCGATPPSVVLEIDHVLPIAKGGTNEEMNLVTACEPCNSGKGAVLLTKVPESVAKRAEREQKMQEQLAAYYEMVASRKENLKNRAMQIAHRLDLWDEDRTMSADWGKGIMKFVERLSPKILDSLIDNANDNLAGMCQERRFKFFAKSCWNVIRQMESSNG